MDSTFTLGSEYANIRQTIETAIPGKRWSACKITNVLVVWGSKRERLMEILRIRRDTHVQHCVARRTMLPHQPQHFPPDSQLMLRTEPASQEWSPQSGKCREYFGLVTQ
jgi:hypothetical protein